MKKFIFAVAVCSFSIFSYSQNSSVERAIFGIQTGYFGFWVYNEAKISSQFVLRSEVGIGGGIFGSEFGVTNGVFDGFQINDELIISILFSLEPRWYYNLRKRNSQ